MDAKQTLFILGRQPALGLAELESLYGPGKLQLCGNQAALLDGAFEAHNFSRLGGSLKAAQVITTLPTTNWSTISRYLTDDLSLVVDFSGNGKLTIGLSAYGFSVSAGKIMATGLELKKSLRQTTGRSVRLVSNNDTSLSSAQIIHNNLIANGYEIVVANSGKETVIARTLAEQDIESYTRRDRGRPMRDSKVGMLPPKLAQIIINLAVDEAASTKDNVVLDPFCGTGVVLIEASLMGFGVFGSDLEPRMISYSEKNLQWLTTTQEGKENLPDAGIFSKLEVGDATTHTWLPAPQFVACETYLGRPFTSQPTPEILEQTVSEVNLILKKFLRNIHNQLDSGSRLCLAVPAWQTTPNTFRHLPLIDQISDLGYNRVSFEHVLDSQLLYYREDQHTARELLVLTRK